MLTFSVTVSDGDGACSSPCDADDVLSYHATMRNNGPDACFLNTPTSCVVEEIRIDGTGPHGDLVATYTPMCDEALTEHVLGSGEAINESVEGGLLDDGYFIATANFAMDTSLAFGSSEFSVE